MFRLYHNYYDSSWEHLSFRSFDTDYIRKIFPKNPGTEISLVFWPACEGKEREVEFWSCVGDLLLEKKTRTAVFELRNSIKLNLEAFNSLLERIDKKVKVNLVTNLCEEVADWIQKLGIQLLYLK